MHTRLGGPRSQLPPRVWGNETQGTLQGQASFWSLHPSSGGLRPSVFLIHLHLTHRDIVLYELCGV